MQSSEEGHSMLHITRIAWRESASRWRGNGPAHTRIVSCSSKTTRRCTRNENLPSIWQSAESTSFPTHRPVPTWPHVIFSSSFTWRSDYLRLDSEWRWAQCRRPHNCPGHHNECSASRFHNCAESSKCFYRALAKRRMSLSAIRWLHQCHLLQETYDVLLV